MPPLELAFNSVIDPLDKIDEFTPPDLQLLEPVEKAGLTDDDHFDIDNMLPTTGKSGVKSALLQNICCNDLELSHTEDNTFGYSGQATSCAPTRQSEELLKTYTTPVSWAE